jgi:ParB/RepB/Spo0J family partition protein
MATSKGNLKYRNPKEISFSPENPRGEKEEDIKKSVRFKALVDSIKLYGVLEPLIVKKDGSGIKPFILVDGERRLRASLEAGLEEVPLMIAKNEHDARVLAYQVHMLRENWSPLAETRALRKLIKDLRENKPDITEGEITKELKSITAHKSDTLKNRMILLKYDERVIEMALSGEILHSHLIQMEASFISKLKRNYTKLFDNYGDKKIRKILVKKVLKDLMGNTRFLMDEFKVVFEDKDNKKEVKEILNGFLDIENKSIEDTLDEYNELLAKKEKAKAKTKKKAKRKTKKAKAKKRRKKETFSYRNINITPKQQTRFEDIKNQLDNIGGELSDEEYEYVSEAVFCLKDSYLKAATLMVWAAGISRILKYISKNLIDFNKSSKEMHDSPKSIYKYISPDFQYKAKSIEDIREASKDKQLVCYLLYKNIIKKTECRKLFHNYDVRCDCAHPTDITLKPNEVISIFENVYDFIFTNEKIK